MITDDLVDDVCQKISRVRKELDQFKDVIADAVSKLNARITALEQRLPTRWGPAPGRLRLSNSRARRPGAVAVLVVNFIQTLSRA
jgi:hypothetical protein